MKYTCDKNHCSDNCPGHFDPNNEPVCKRPDGEYEYTVGTTSIFETEQLYVMSNTPATVELQTDTDKNFIRRMKKLIWRNRR